MSEEGGHGNLLLENNSWVFPTSDNSGGSEEKSGKNPPDSSSNSPTATTRATTSVGGQKRSRKGVQKIGKGGGEWNDGKGGGESDHEIHIWTERERRKKMRNMFSNLHALLPHLPAKADKSTIVDEAVNYIKTLQGSLQKLQKQRLEMLRGTIIIDCEPSIAAPTTRALDSREAFFADQGSSRNLAMTTTATMNSPHSLLVPHLPSCFQTWSSPNVVLNVCSDDAQISVCAPRKPGILSTLFYVLEKHKLEVVTAHISSDYYTSMYMIHAHASGASDQFPEALPVEEIYKLAVGEMMFWLST